MSKYGAQIATGGLTTAVTAKTAIMLFGGGAATTAKNCEVIEAIMTGGGSVASADVQHQAMGTFCGETTLGAGTGITAEPFNQVSAAAQGSPVITWTTEPTTYDTIANVFFGFNQRGGQRWAVPQGEGVKVNFNNTKNRWGWKVLSSAAGNVEASLNWWED